MTVSLRLVVGLGNPGNKYSGTRVKTTAVTVELEVWAGNSCSSASRAAQVCGRADDVSAFELELRDDAGISRARKRAASQSAADALAIGAAEAAVATAPLPASCAQVLTSNPSAPSGNYTIRTAASRAPLNVCESRLLLYLSLVCLEAWSVSS